MGFPGPAWDVPGHPGTTRKQAALRHRSGMLLLFFVGDDDGIYYINHRRDGWHGPWRVGGSAARTPYGLDAYWGVDGVGRVVFADMNHVVRYIKIHPSGVVDGSQVHSFPCSVRSFGTPSGVFDGENEYLFTLRYSMGEWGIYQWLQRTRVHGCTGSAVSVFWPGQVRFPTLAGTAAVYHDGHIYVSWAVRKSDQFISDVMQWDADMIGPEALTGTECRTALKCWNDCYADGAASCYSWAMSEPRTPDILFTSLPSDRASAERIFVAFPASSSRYTITRFAPDPVARKKTHRTRMLPLPSSATGTANGVEMLQYGNLLLLFENNKYRMFWLYN